LRLRGPRRDRTSSFALISDATEESIRRYVAFPRDEAFPQRTALKSRLGPPPGRRDGDQAERRPFRTSLESRLGPKPAQEVSPGAVVLGVQLQTDARVVCVSALRGAPSPHEHGRRRPQDARRGHQGVAPGQAGRAGEFSTGPTLLDARLLCQLAFLPFREASASSAASWAPFSSFARTRTSLRIAC
jgi:hypothetical protein